MRKRYLTGWVDGAPELLKTDREVGEVTEETDPYFGFFIFSRVAEARAYLEAGLAERTGGTDTVEYQVALDEIRTMPWGEEGVL